MNNKIPSRPSLPNSSFLGERPGKIFDIRPPKTETVGFNFGPPESEKKEKRRDWRLIFGPAILMIFGIAGYLFLPRAEIDIWPRTETITVKEKVEFKEGIKEPDFSAKFIPGDIFEISQETSQGFTPSGKTAKEERATGQIKVYNSYSEAPQTLVANTRFVSAEGKLFRSTQRVTIPGGHYEKGKLVPGTLDVYVVAAEAGESHNIGPSTFSIPGFAGSPKYTAFYGKSLAPMTGGFKGTVQQVTADDLSKAKNSLSGKLFEEGRAAIENKILPEVVLLDGGFSQEIKEAVFSAQEKETVSSFNLRLKVVSKALVFKKADLENFAKEFVLQKLPRDKAASGDIWLKKEMQKESLRVYPKLESVDLGLRKATLGLDISAKVYPGIEETLLKKTLIGKSFKETVAFLKEQSPIVKAETKFWPFWANRVPQQIERIKVKINLD